MPWFKGQNARAPRNRGLSTGAAIAIALSLFVVLYLITR